MFGGAQHSLFTRRSKEELGLSLKILRPLWLNQSFFNEVVDKKDYHELCIYFLMDISDSAILDKGDKFTFKEEAHANFFEWLPFERLKNEYFYPAFLKESIFHLPSVFTIRTETE